MAKSYEELQFTDDFMFGKVMEDKELCKELLECLLGHPVGQIEDLHIQKECRVLIDGKPIRLDVYACDENTIYDAEMQNMNHSSLESMQLPKRSRSYQSLIDADYLKKGYTYRSLPEGNILFLCTFDPFGIGYPQYTFENRCLENLDLSLRDMTTKIFFNCTYDAEDIRDNIRELYHFMQTGERTNQLTDRIAHAVERAKLNEIWRTEYMKELMILEDATAEGYEMGKSEGIEIGRDDTYKSLIFMWLEKGKNTLEIAEELGKSEEFVQNLIREAES